MFDLQTILRLSFFVASLTGVVAIFFLSLLTAIDKSLQFFPPPNTESWQHGTFVWLFRLYLYPLIALSLFTIEQTADHRLIWQYSLGTLLVVAGFGLALWITFQMGWRSAFGEKSELRTDGWFQWSRNPIYVATWVGMIGWGLIANDGLISILLLLWAMMYLIAPFFEEPWLEKQYGDEYVAYKARTRRFI